MPKFSATSLSRLHTCDPALQCIAYKAIETVDFSVLCGYRNKEDQDEAVQTGHSKLRWPQSAHNQTPAVGYDLAPTPLNWADLDSFRQLSEHILAIAELLKIPVVWGGDWEHFKDYPHFELKSFQG